MFNKKLLLSALLVNCMGFGAQAATSDALVAHWSFDEIVDNKVVDAKGGLETKINSKRQKLVEGKHGKALTFVRSPLKLDKKFMKSVSDEITLSVVSKGWSPKAQNNIFKALDRKGNRVIQTHLPHGNGKVYIDLGNDKVVAKTYDRVQANMPAGVSQDEWLHWVMTKNTSTGQTVVYLNGEEIGRKGNQKQGFSLLKSFELGEQYTGAIDDVKVFNKALSAEEVKALFTQG